MKQVQVQGILLDDIFSTFQTRHEKASCYLTLFGKTFKCKYSSSSDTLQFEVMVLGHSVVFGVGAVFINTICFHLNIGSSSKYK